MTRPIPLLALALAAALTLTTPHQAHAQDPTTISIGVTSAITSMDPHFHNLSSNFNVGLNIFDRLIDQDPAQRLTPGLATTWKPLDDTTWEFTLRQGVTFHDGSPFGAEDVAASIRRVGWVPNSPGPYTVYTRAITGMTVIDDHTIRFTTATPYPLLPTDLSSIFIIPRRLEHAPTTDFNAGTAAIGTGPFALTRYTPGDRITLRRNDTYWGKPPAWQTATIRMIPINATRVAALLANDVQAIDNVPPSDAARLRADPAITVGATKANSVLFLHMDQFRDQTPFVTDKSGNPLPRNPFKDIKVRRALSLAINRQAVTDRVMEGAAVPAGQLLADGFFGVSPNLKPDPFDPAAARKLLTEAGYPEGFAMTIHGPNDRYINDAAVLQAIAPMFTRIGIETKPIALPWALYVSQASAPTYAFSVMLIGNSATTGEASFPLRSQVGTVDPKTGMGTSNRARYSNPEVDTTIAAAMRTVDDPARAALLQKTAEIAAADQAVIPILHMQNVFATRKPYRYTPRADGFLAAPMITRD